MKRLQTILFPTEFSHASLETVPYAKEMAQRFDAGVIVLHASGLAREYLPAPYLRAECAAHSTAIPYTAALREIREKRQKQLDEFANAQFADVRHSVRLEDGEPAAAIESVARQQNADVIFLSTKGLSRFRRLLLGSITAQVLHDVSIPVFTSAHEYNPSSSAGAGFHSIVCALDLTLEADAVLQTACFLAQTYGASLCLVHMQLQSNAHSSQFSEQLLRKSLQEVTAAERESAAPEVKVLILDRPVAEGIRLVAREEKADLVIVGRGHEQGAISRIWSHLYTIICDVPCPVLSV